MPDIDFGFDGNKSVDNDTTITNPDGDDKTNLTTGKIDHDKNGVPVDTIDDGQQTTTNPDEGNDDTNKNKNDDPNKGNDDDKNKSTESELTEGMTVEADGQTYTVDKDGNLIDENGNIFKEAKDVKDWIASFDKVEDDNHEISIGAIQEAIGIDITDENDKPIEYENTIEGIKSYVQAVMDVSKQEHYEAAINTLYQKYPILNDVLNYYIANGNSLEGFNEVPDRSNITIDDTNEKQQEEIIRMAWKEQGRKGDVDGYIAYLKSSGTLLATAKDELEGMQEADAEYKKQLEQEAQKKEQQRIKDLETYWNGVHDVIKTRKIAGYQIPESIIISRNGQKITVTPEDFFNYIYNVDDNGTTAYERDLAKQDVNSRRDDEILRAYLTFVGGNYSNLVDMAINKQQVANLRLKSKQNTHSTVRINKPANSKKDNTNIDLGYN